MTSLKRILVLGGSGFVGRHLCQHLAHLPADITVATRQPVTNGTPVWPQVTWIQADVLQPQVLSDLVRDQDVVIHLVAILHGHRSQFDQLHVQLPRMLAQCCAAAGVQHLIHVSAIGADAQGPSMYQRSKGQGELALQAVAEQTGLPISILRPSVIFGLDDQFINTFARVQRYAPLVPLASARTRFQPVWVEDVARALTALARTGPGPIRLWEACGPEVFTLADLVRHAGRWGRCERVIVPLPAALGKMQAMLMEYLPGKTLMSRDNVDSMRVDNVASNELPGLEALGIQATALSQVFDIP